MEYPSLSSLQVPTPPKPSLTRSSNLIRISGKTIYGGGGLIEEEQKNW